MSRPGRRRRLQALALVLLGLGPGRAAARAEDERASLEYPVKASLLLNFAKFVEWPIGSHQAAASSVSICVLGPDPFGPVLDSIMAGRRVGGRPIEVKRFGRLEGIESCHVLFIASAGNAILGDALARLRQQPVLTVGESSEFCERGGIINLSVQHNHAAFSVNLAPAELNHLKLSSKLLGVAASVRLGANQ